MGLLDILQNAMNSANPEQHFDNVTKTASPDELSAGLAGACVPLP